MTLGFHYHIPALQKSDGVYTRGMIGLFIDELSGYFENVICFMHEPVKSEMPKLDYVLKSKNIKLVSLGKHDFFLRRHLRSGYVKKALLANIDGIDMMLTRGPSPLLPLISGINIRHKIPNAMLLVGDYEKGLRAVRISLWKKILLGLYYKTIQTRQRRLARESMIMVNSCVLFEEYKNIARHCYEVSTSTISRRDIIPPAERMMHDPVRLLFTGRIEPAKGIDIIIEAMNVLCTRGIKSELHLAGWEESKGYLSHLRRLAGRYNLQNSVHFHGAKKIGPELFSEYQNADIFIVSTTGNEGFPRTIWEAMANAVPVISSSIGSIPFLLTDYRHAVLFEPGNYRMLADKINELVTSPGLRAGLVHDSGELILKYTIEEQTKLMANLMIYYCLNMKQSPEPARLVR